MCLAEQLAEQPVVWSAVVPFFSRETDKLKPKINTHRPLSHKPCVAEHLVHRGDHASTPHALEGSTDWASLGQSLQTAQTRVTIRPKNQKQPTCPSVPLLPSIFAKSAMSKFLDEHIRQQFPSCCCADLSNCTIQKETFSTQTTACTRCLMIATECPEVGSVDTTKLGQTLSTCSRKPYCEVWPHLFLQGLHDPLLPPFSGLKRLYLSFMLGEVGIPSNSPTPEPCFHQNSVDNSPPHKNMVLGRGQNTAS